MKFRLSGIAELLGAPLQGEDADCSDVSIDTRTLGPGALFVALSGDRFDGHHFVARARKAGAAGAVVQKSVDTVMPVIQVADTRAALGRIAAWWREQFDLPVAAVTGSNGKTTVKEMLAAVCRQAGPTLATRGNLNNDIGVPLTLFDLAAEHEYAVIEMGANHPGEIARLCAIARPGVGIVTNASSAHLEGFRSLSGVVRAKGEMFEHLPDDGVAVINADDPSAGAWRELAGDRRVMDFSLEAKSACRARFDGEDAVIETPEGEVRTRLALPGRHNLANAAAATAAAIALGIDPERIGAGLAGVRPVPGRLTLTTAPGGHRVIDDAYNANPASLQAGVDYLASLEGEHWLALGAMGELGGDAARLHGRAGQQARDAGVDRLFTVGDAAKSAAESFGRGAMHFDDQDALVRALRDNLHGDVVCLVKGSRSAAMERVVQALLAMNDNENDNGAASGAGRGA